MALTALEIEEIKKEVLEELKHQLKLQVKNNVSDGVKTFTINLELEGEILSSIDIDTWI